MNSLDQDTVLFEYIGVFCDLVLDVLLCLFGQLDLHFFLIVEHPGLLFAALLERGCDGLVLPANLVSQTTQQGKLTERKERT